MLLSAQRSPLRRAGLHARRTLATPSSVHRLSVRSASAIDDRFYNRDGETKFLEDMLLEEPNLFVLTGPANCGKTALLRKISSGKQDNSCLVLNLRATDTTNPLAFASFLEEALREYRSLADRVTVVSTTATVAVFGSTASKETRPKDSPPLLPLGIMLKELKRWLDGHQGDSPPVIIIDEANRLHDWRGDADNAALQGLLDFLVMVSKEQSKCHVLLATSDDLMIFWLQQRGLREDQYTHLTLGNLPEHDAKIYVCGDTAEGGWPGLLKLKHSAACEKGFSLPDDLWPEVYNVCGGNIRALNLACVLAAVCFSAAPDQDLRKAWEQGVGEKKRQAASLVERGFEPLVLSARGDQKALWTPQQWEAVLSSIAEAKAPHHAVPLSELKEILGQGDKQAGAEVIESLVKFNMLSYRQFSPMAFDLPPEVHGPRNQPVITATSAAVRDHIVRGEWRQSPSQAKGAAVQAAVLSPEMEVERKIQAVEGKISAVEKNIDAAVTEIADLKQMRPTGFLAELAKLLEKRQLREKERQLREEEKQLREEKKQLQEEKLLLMKQREKKL